MATKETTGTNTKILAKLWQMMSELTYIKKDKKNTFFNYTYASEYAVKEAVQEQLIKHKVIFQFGVTDWHTTNLPSELVNGKWQPQEQLTTIKTSYKFIDVDSGEFIEGSFAGTGSDKNDKGVYKAITGAIKYTLTSIFLIPSGDHNDPEHDVPNTDQEQPPQGKQQTKPANEQKQPTEPTKSAVLPDMPPERFAKFIEAFKAGKADLPDALKQFSVSLEQIAQYNKIKSDLGNIK